MVNPLVAKADETLQQLCYGFGSRRTGTVGNREATDYVAEVFSGFGFEVECPQFDCMDWTHGDTQLTVGETMYEAFVSPYSLGCDVTAELAIATTVDELTAGEYTGKILLLMGDIASEQLMPKNFVFYNPEHHQQIIALLEEKAPAAIISATTRNPEVAGGVYPFSLIQDGDFMIPSVYMTAEEGERLRKNVGQRAKLMAEATRLPATGCNVIARKCRGQNRKITVFAHIDTQENTPGALDNAAGVVVILLLAQLLQDYTADVELEFVALNGEDYYGANGEMQYWNDYDEDFDRIMLGINIDAAGYVDGPTAYSTYGCPDVLQSEIESVMDSYDGIVEGEAWYQSDHSLFIQRNRPALAVTSDKFMHLTTHITHTEKDVPELVDIMKLVEVARSLAELIRRLAEDENRL